MEPVTFLQASALLDYDPETGRFTWKPSGRPRWDTRWAGKAAGFVERNGYIRLRLGGRKFQASRVAWLLAHGLWPETEIDHINGNRADNRLANLREATASQNKVNTKRRNRTGLKGVWFHPQIKRWRATIGHGGKTINLGTYETPELAHGAYLRAAHELYGEFGRVR